MPGIYRDYEKIIEIYNATGSKDAQTFIHDTYGTQNPWALISRMKKFSYDKNSQKFIKNQVSTETAVFLNLDDLCQIRAQTQTPDTQLNDLYQELVQEKLLLLLHYVKLDTVGRMVSINKNRLTTDGYQLKLE
ncbi:hypothetical protein [Acetobacterium tundrae]|uniref:Uncharacterized protein n=1 Tax=Acetobacterium tundrae TaxID=132932 RepID=A0ABR6WPT8_9FIRM|nr:hypothetical protein [Acetobacterium tundrae]MBC3798510.1 hypothetical protein [Acetobacterium tundrae]